MDKKKLQKELNSLKSINKEEPHDKSSLEANIAKNLDEILLFYGDELMSIPIDSLYNIFFHSKRKLIDHNRAYMLIKENSVKQKNSDLFILFPSIDGAKLNEENLKDAILSKDIRDGNIPKINYFKIFEKIEKQNQSIRTKIFTFFCLFILMAILYYHNLNEIFSKQQDLLDKIKSLDKELNSKLSLNNNDLTSKINLLEETIEKHKISFQTSSNNLANKIDSLFQSFDNHTKSFKTNNVTLSNKISSLSKKFDEDKKSFKMANNDLTSKINLLSESFDNHTKSFKKNNVTLSNKIISLSKKFDEDKKSFKMANNDLTSKINLLSESFDNHTKSFKKNNNTLSNKIISLSKKFDEDKKSFKMANNDLTSKINILSESFDNHTKSFTTSKDKLANRINSLFEKLKKQKYEYYGFKKGLDQSIFVDINISSPGIIQKLNNMKKNEFDNLFIASKSSKDIYNIIDKQKDQKFTFSINTNISLEFKFKNSVQMEGIKIYAINQLFPESVDILINGEECGITYSLIDHYKTTYKFKPMSSNSIQLKLKSNKKHFSLKNIEILSPEKNYSKGVFSTLLSQCPKHDVHNCGVKISSSEYDYEHFYMINSEKDIYNFDPGLQWFQVELTRGSGFLTGFRLQKNLYWKLRNFKLIGTLNYTDDIDSWMTLLNVNERKSNEHNFTDVYKLPQISPPIRFIRLLNTGPNWDQNIHLDFHHLDFFGYYVPIKFDN